MSITDDTPVATPLQFGKVLLRMMPSSLSAMPEARMTVAIFVQAFEDAAYYTHARNFFTERAGPFDLLCRICGFDPSQVQAMYLKHNRHHRDRAMQAEYKKSATKGNP